jgi:hypothetical protein
MAARVLISTEPKELTKALASFPEQIVGIVAGP